jgi:hypothetical protein
MKATTIIIAAIFILQITSLFAENNITRSKVNDETVIFYVNKLSPSTPVEATFEEISETTTLNFDLSVLAPVTPYDADFSDVVPEKNLDFSILAPVTPSTAEFDDMFDLPFDLNILAPVTPAEADFE